MAATINLTPASADYSLVVRVGTNDVEVPTDGTPAVINSAGAASLIGGAVDHISIDFASVAGVGGVFKKPPFVLNCELREASINGTGGNALLADFTKDVIVTPDGRIYFKPTILAAIKRAVPGGVIHTVPVGAVNNITIKVSASPVYNNPSGETPDYVPQHFSIKIDTSTINWADLVPADWAEAERWIDYTDDTTLTPAGIGALTGE